MDSAAGYNTVSSAPARWDSALPEMPSRAAPAGAFGRPSVAIDPAVMHQVPFGLRQCLLHHRPGQGRGEGLDELVGEVAQARAARCRRRRRRRAACSPPAAVSPGACATRPRDEARLRCVPDARDIGQVEALTNRFTYRAELLEVHEIGSLVDCGPHDGCDSRIMRGMRSRPRNIRF